MEINPALTLRYSLAAILLGGYALWLGIAQARQADTGAAPLSLLEYLIVFIVRLFRGPESQARMVERLSNPERIRRSSRSYKLLGGIILGIGVLQIVLLVLLAVLPA